MNTEKLLKILTIMEKEVKKLNPPILRKEKVINKDEFKIVVFAVLSTRTKDEITIKVCRKLFKKIKCWKDIIDIDQKKLENLIYGIGFYKNKAKFLKLIAKEIIEKYNGKVPNSFHTLIKLPGIGNKVAKIILNEIFNLPVIAVDTHVHRISNRIGIVNTKNVKETEEILEKIVPNDLKIKYNKIFVAYGQTICLPKNPLCKKCKIKEFCNFYISKLL